MKHFFLSLLIILCSTLSYAQFINHVDVSFLPKPVDRAEIEKTKISLANKSLKDTSAAAVYYKLAVLFLDKQNDSAFFYVKQALPLYNKVTNMNGQGNCNSLLGEIYFQQGLFTQALHYHLEADKLFRKSGQQNLLANNLNLLGLVYFYTKNIPAATKSHKEALGIYKSLNNQSGIAQTLGWLGHVLEKQAQYKEALQHQLQALDIYEKTKDKYGQAVIHENIASIYEDLGKMDLALVHYTRSLDLNKETGQNNAIINLYNNLGDVYRKTGNYTEALKYTQVANDMSKLAGNNYQLKGAYRDLAKTYSLMGSLKEALEYEEKAYQLYEKIYSEESAHQIAQLQTFYEIEKKNNEIKVLEKDAELQQLYKYAIIAGAVLAALLSFLLYNRIRLKQEKNKKIMEQEKELLKQQHQLTDVELNNSKLNELKLKTEIENGLLKERQLQGEIETKGKALASHTLHIIEKNKILAELKVKLEETIQAEAKDKNKQLKELVRMIDFSFNKDKDWEDFTAIFEQVHHSFFTKLKEICPDLSSSDLRLCALMKLNVLSKDIATILGISVDSLRISRYRLRKKLNMEGETNLHTFIQQL